MTSRLRFLCAALGLSATIFARGESAPARPAAIRPVSPILAILDTDHNGTLSAGEISMAPVALAALDLNDDGVISSAEWRASNAEGRPIRVGRNATSFNVVLTLDANHDGDIQPMEIANAVSSLKRLDLNGDGELTLVELRPTVVAQSRA
jgi:hypothetical protein